MTIQDAVQFSLAIHEKTTNIASEYIIPRILETVTELCNLQIILYF